MLRSPKRALRLWLDQRREVVHEPRPGWPLRCPQVAVDMAFNLQRDDPPQVEEFDDFLRLIRAFRDPLLFDIGCHFGLFSFAVAHYCGAGTRAVAVDPSGVACRMVERIRDQNQWQAQIQALIQRRAKVFIHSSLPDDVVRRCFLQPVKDIGAFVRQRLAELGSEARIAVLPQGPLTIPYLA